MKTKTKTKMKTEMKMAAEYRALTEREAAALLAGMMNEKVDVVSHASPDADTLGCALALTAIINENGGDAAVVCSDRVPDHLCFLTDGVEISDALRDGARRVAVDIASPPQLGRLVDAAGTFSLMLDHHGRGETFADHVVEPGAAACGEVVFRVTEILGADYGVKIPASVYSYIYAAISGDTGSFRFANTTAETHRIAARLHEAGADTVRIAHDLHAVKTLGELAALRLGLANMKLLHGGRLAMTSATLGEMAENGIKDGDFSEADEMRSVLGAYIGVSLRESEPGVWRASTRANVDIDCAAVCAEFGGGGHRGAAGCTLRGFDRAGAEAAMEKSFGRAIEEFEAGI